MNWGYPLDVAGLLARAQKSCGKSFLKHVATLAREDEKLSAFVWEVGRGWFPVRDDRKTQSHGVDIGIPDGGDRGLWQMPVRAIGDGQVFHADSYIPSNAGADFGRVIVKHKTPEGDVYALYMQLGAIHVITGALVKAGDALGTIGWYDKFHHLKFAIARAGGPGGELARGRRALERAARADRRA